MQIMCKKEYEYVRPFTLYVCLSVNVYLAMPDIPLVALSLFFGYTTEVAPNATRYATQCSMMHDILIEWLRFLRRINKLALKGSDAERIPCSVPYETQPE
jgi:hypothetical protein